MPFDVALQRYRRTHFNILKSLFFSLYPVRTPVYLRIGLPLCNPVASSSVDQNIGRRLQWLTGMTDSIHQRINTLQKNRTDKEPPLTHRSVHVAIRAAMLQT